MIIENSENKRKRLIYQSFYRGCKETDIILGKFAKKYLPEFNEKELAMFEEILEENDRDIFEWLCGKQAVPNHLKNKVTDLLLQFKLVG